MVLLDSIAAQAAPHNNASPASGRVRPVVSIPRRCTRQSASWGPRSIERAGRWRPSSPPWSRPVTGDTVIFEEFKGTGGTELKLDRKIAERRDRPVGVNPSGTRKDELLLSPDEFAIVHKLRRVLSGLDSPHQAIDLLIMHSCVGRRTTTNSLFRRCPRPRQGSMDGELIRRTARLAHLSVFGVMAVDLA